MKMSPGNSLRSYLKQTKMYNIFLFFVSFINIGELEGRTGPDWCTGAG
jgi:hypothetical protein